MRKRYIVHFIIGEEHILITRKLCVHKLCLYMTYSHNLYNIPDICSVLSKV